MSGRENAGHLARSEIATSICMASVGTHWETSLQDSNSLNAISLQEIRIFQRECGMFPKR